MEIDEGCKGCFSFENNICEILTLGFRYSAEKCPCKECLIKVVCEDGCENYYKFRGEYPYEDDRRV